MNASYKRDFQHDAMLLIYKSSTFFLIFHYRKLLNVKEKTRYTQYAVSVSFHYPIYHNWLTQATVFKFVFVLSADFSTGFWIR